MKQPLKILHTESHIEWGGQERRVFNESRYMVNSGHRVVLIAPERSQIYEKMTREGWETYAVTFSKTGLIEDFFRVRSLLRKIRPDVLNTHGNIDSKVALTAARAVAIPCIIRSRHHSHPVKRSWHNRILYRRLCDYVFTTGSRITDQIIRDLGVPARRVVTLPSGIDPPRALPEREEARRALAAELGVDRETRFVGCVAMLRDWKGHAVLIDAFDRIKAAVPRHHLVLVGEGRFRPALEQQVQRRTLLARAHLLGYRDNPWPYFRAFDCNVLASTKNEGIPQVLLQAMFAGCPVIGTTAGGIPDIVADGRTGLLVAPDNSERLAEALLRTLDDPEPTGRRVKEAMRYVYANHTLDMMGERILGLYAEALSRARDY